MSDCFGFNLIILFWNVHLTDPFLLALQKVTYKRVLNSQYIRRNSEVVPKIKILVCQYAFSSIRMDLAPNTEIFSEC